MSKRTVQLLGEVCEITMGQAPAGESYNTTGEGLPLLAGAADLGDTRPRPTRFTTEATKVSHPGDIIICIRATIGGRNWSDRAYCLGRGVAALRPRNDMLDPAYLWHYLSAIEPILARRGRGSTFKQVSSKDIATLPIHIPALSEQRRIAIILDRADAIRRKRGQTAEIIDDLLRSVFREMFGDLVLNTRQWPSRELAEVSEIGSGVMKGRDLQGRDVIELPYLRVANVQDGYLDLNEIKTIMVPTGEVDKYRLMAGDVLMTEGGDFDKLGRGAIWRGQILDCVHQNHIYRIRPRAAALVPEYLSALGGSSYGKRYFMSCAKQTTGIATINKTQLGRLPVLLPPIELQKKYSGFVHQHEAAIQRIISATACADDLRESVQNSVFSGSA